MPCSSISPRPVLRNVGNMVPEEDLCRYTPRPILMKPVLTPSSSESVRKFSLDDIILADTDEEGIYSEEEATSVVSSSSLDLDFSDIFTIDSDSEEEMMVVEE